jgi:hypothetical protein
MGILVLGKSRYQDVSPQLLSGAYLVSDNEAVLLQLGEQIFYINGVIWKNFGLDLFGPIFELAFAICQTPQASEKQSGRKRAVSEHFVGEKPGFEEPYPSHGRPPFPRSGFAQTHAPPSSFNPPS